MKDTLCSNLHKWQSVGASETMLDWIGSGMKFHLVEPISNFEFNNKTFPTKKEPFYSLKYLVCYYLDV